MTKKRRRGKRSRRKEATSGGGTWFRCRVSAFAHAGRGVWIALKTQPHFQIHVLAAIAVITLGFVFQVTAGEWIALLLCIGSVLAAEAFNTAVESLADALSTDPHPLMGKAKDTAAAAVLILAAISVAVGTLVFWKYIFP